MSAFGEQLRASTHLKSQEPGLHGFLQTFLRAGNRDVLFGAISAQLLTTKDVALLGELVALDKALDKLAMERPA